MERGANLQICHAPASATRVNQGVEPWLSQQPLASDARSGVSCSISTTCFRKFATVLGLPIVVSFAPPHHRHAPRDSLLRCVLPSAAKPCSSALPQSSDDQPSAKSRLRVVLTCPASSSLHSRHSRSTGNFLTFPEVLRRARISGMKGVRIYGTDNFCTVSSGIRVIGRVWRNPERINF
jgi:hypothetical protein